MTTEDIRAEIQRTRVDLDDTLDALGHRLRPQFMMESVLRRFHESRGGRNTRETAGCRAADPHEQIRNHPLLSVLIGAGLAYYLYRANHAAVDSPAPGRTEPPPWGRDLVRPSHQEQPHDGDPAQASLHDKPSGALESASDRRRLHESASRNRPRPRNCGPGQPGENPRFPGPGEAVHQRMLAASFRFEDGLARFVHRNPLAVGCTAVMLGMAIALAIPSTQPERWLAGR